MPPSNVPGLVAGAVALGAIHGAEPGHGWPIAASYAFERANRWLSGAAAGLVIGTGHLISSIAVVGVFFLVRSRLALENLNESLAVAGVSIGSPIGVFAGVLLVLLGIREYRSDGHSHDHGDDGGADGGHDDHGHDQDHGDGDHSHDHGHDHHDHGHGHDHHDHDHGDDDHDHDHGDDHHEHGHSDHHDHGHDHHEHGHGHGGHSHDHDDEEHSHGGVLASLVGVLPFVGGGGHGHDHGRLSEATDGGLSAIAFSAFVLGFAHEEEFEIIAICAGSDYCLSLMLIYAVTVVGVITALTLLLVAGYETFEDRMERISTYFPTISAVVLVVMGLGFLLGVF